MAGGEAPRSIPHHLCAIVIRRYPRSWSASPHLTPTFPSVSWQIPSSVIVSSHHPPPLPISAKLPPFAHNPNLSSLHKDFSHQSHPPVVFSIHAFARIISGRGWPPKRVRLHHSSLNRYFVCFIHTHGLYMYLRSHMRFLVVAEIAGTSRAGALASSCCRGRSWRGRSSVECANIHNLLDPHMP